VGSTVERQNSTERTSTRQRSFIAATDRDGAPARRALSKSPLQRGLPPLIAEDSGAVPPPPPRLLLLQLLP